MDNNLTELLGKNFYNYVAEDMVNYEGDDREDTFIMRPVVDFVFKQLFGDAKRTDMLKALLSAILNLPKEEFNELAILNSELARDSAEDKQGILDIRATMGDGKQIDIEIQVIPFTWMPERSLYYWAKMYTQQIKKGDSFSALKKCIAINILDYEFPLAKRVHSVYHMIDQEDMIKLSEVIEVHFVDLEKLRKGMGIENLDPSLNKWLRFLAAKKKEEFEMLAKNDKDIKTAYERLQELSADDKQRMVYEAREAWLMDQRTMKEVAHQEGLEQGISKGRLEANREIASRALKSGLSVEIVAEITGLSEEELTLLNSEA